MSFQTNTFVFETLRSDYEEASKILEKYVNQGKLMINEISTYLRKNTWITRFTITGTFNDYETLCDELEEHWLLA